ncbi:MAG: hypothetical protein ACJ76P_08395 [Actinomycetota bacterium]
MSVLTLVTVLATAAVALAANPVRGAKYSGTIKVNGGLAISFNVTSDGKDVVKMKVPQPPIFCPGGGPPPPQKRAKPAPISNTGTFTDKLKYVSSTGSVIATLKVTGAFHTHHKESGKATVSWSAASCNGSALYSTKTA